MKCRPDMMGKIVTVHAETRRIKCGGKATSEQVSVTPRAGWIVGQRRMDLGDVQGGYDEPGFLRIKESKTLVAVCYWPTMKPVLVSSGCFEEGGVPVSPAKQSWIDSERKNPECTAKYRKELSVYAREQPRKNGKWVKDEAHATQA